MTPITINPLELVSISQDIAQLNLGYLGISVAILGVLGGVFVYFNIKPLKESLDKQENKIDSVKSKADELLDNSKDLIDSSLDSFKEEVQKNTAIELEKQYRNIMSFVDNSVLKVKNELLEYIENIFDKRDVKLKEILLSENKNGLANLDKEITDKIQKNKNEISSKINKLVSEINGLQNDLKESKRKIRELEVYKYSKEGQMGAIIGSIELLKESIDEKTEWRIVSNLELLYKNIDGFIIKPKYVADIEKQLSRIDGEGQYSILVNKIRDYCKNQ